MPPPSHAGPDGVPRGGGAPSRGRPLRVLVITRNFPNRLEPLACAFARQQLAALARRATVEVLATVPYLPGAGILGSRARARRLRALPRRDVVAGVRVVHPRVPYIPGAARLPALVSLNAPLYLAGLLPYLPGLVGRFDVVLGTHLFPDACAAVAAARLLGLPCVVKAHGTDVNVVARWPGVQPILARALREARFAAGVSRPLVEALVRLGAPADRAVLLPNGVDRTVFHPQGRAEARHALGLPVDDRIVAFVGGLDREKGVLELVVAFERLRSEAAAPVHVVLVGEGPLEAELRAASTRLGAQGGRLILAGAQDLAGVARFLAAADLLALPSWDEGTPNVVLEALAAGRPVVASRVGGIPDALLEGTTGLLVPPRDPEALAGALHEALGRVWNEGVIVASAPPSWDESARTLLELLWAAAGGETRPDPGPPPASRNGASRRRLSPW